MAVLAVAARSITSWASTARTCCQSFFVVEDKPRSARLGLLVALVAMVLQAARVAPLAGRLWAEDGGRFLSEEHALGFRDTFFLHYAGYMHSVPRLSSLAIAALPIEWWAAATTLVAIVVSSLLCGLMARVLVVLGVPRTVSVLLGCLASVTPIAYYEASGSVCNLQWYFVMVAPFALIWAPSRKRTLVLLGAVLLLCGTTAPTSIVVIPLALLRVCCMRPLRALPAWLFVIGWGAQAAVMAQTERPRVRCCPRRWKRHGRSASGSPRSPSPVWP